LGAREVYANERRRRRGGARTGAIAFTVATLGPGAGRADVPERFSLDVEHGENTTSCPTEKELHEAVSARLGYEAFGKSGTRVRVRFESVGGGFSVSSELSSQKGAPLKHTQRARDCGLLLAPTAITLALIVDPLGNGAARPPSDPAPTKTLAADPEPAARAPSSPPPSAVAVSEPSPRWGLRIGLGPQVVVGATPSAAAGAHVAVAARRGAFGVGLEGRGDLPASQSYASGTVSGHVLAVSAVPCLHAAWFSGCVIGTLGTLEGEGEGMRNPSRASALYAAAGARLGLEGRLGRWARLEMQGDVLAGLTRTTMYIDGVGVWTTSPIQGALGITAAGDIW
jgi:hypothetical protein